jgi:hypothetical protein
MDLRKIALGVVSMALGVAGLLCKQALVISLIKTSFSSSAAESVLKSSDGPVGLFFLFTWIIGIWLVIAGLRTKGMNPA